jgi:beta-phosphoglucomutase-like phosphatase (HAD superfamily)
MTVERIAAVLLEPVGCLAEFRAEPFNAAAADLFGAGGDALTSGSQAYWRLIGRIAQQGEIPAAKRSRLEAIELEAVNTADLYPDVAPALAALRDLGAATMLVSSLSRPALDRFIARFSLAELVAGVVARDEAGGVRDKPLRSAIARVPLDPARTMALADTADALALVKELGLMAVLMINDYDEGRALATLNPSAGIVSLAELPDALRIVEQQSGMRAAGKPAREDALPRAPFELFDPNAG